MTFDAYLSVSGRTAVIHLSGKLTDARVPALRALLGQAVRQPVDRLVLRVGELASLTAGGVRCVALAQQELAPGTDLVLEGARDEVLSALRLGGVDAPSLPAALPVPPETAPYPLHRHPSERSLSL
ncbi:MULTISPECIES: STAS domain-containing protein [unclassified Streptomyces]|uniref:STAS domain-containing protein n=1 Tax=unclassified Streptomyces TaxID=2593676 RepID=UPI0033BF4B91